MGGLLTATDVARLLRVSRGTVRRWILNGHLASIKTPGGQYRITQDAANSLMREELIQPEGKVAA